MTLLDFARGPALHWSLIILVGGILLRLVGALLLARARYLSKPRSTHTVWAGIRAIIMRSFPPHAMHTRIFLQHAVGWVMHVGLFIVILFYVPHIEFIRGMTGLHWPGVPSVVISIAGGVTIAVMIFLLFRRMTNPVLRKISTADDYVSWLVTFLPLATGMMAFAHLPLLRYETMLALHILTVELLFIWIPFGKLMHMFTFIPSRAQVGAWFERRGVQA
jgi:nitrate reductase gamma subunit